MQSCRNEISSFRDENKNVIEFFNIALNNYNGERLDSVTDDDIQYFISEMNLTKLPYDSVEFYFIGEDTPSVAFIPDTKIGIGFIKHHFGVNEEIAECIFNQYDATNGGDFYTPTFNVSYEIYKDLLEVNEEGNLGYLIDYLRYYRNIRFITDDATCDELYKPLLDCVEGNAGHIFEVGGLKQLINGRILVEKQLKNNSEFEYEASLYLYWYYKQFEHALDPKEIPSDGQQAYFFLVEATEEITEYLMRQSYYQRYANEYESEEIVVPVD